MESQLVMKSTRHKIVSLSLALLMVFIFLLQPAPALAYDVPVTTYETSDTQYYDYTDIYAASSMGYMGAEWSSAREVWCFNFRFVGTGATRYSTSGTPRDRITIAGMEVEGYANTEHMALWTSGDSRYIGSVPESSGSQPDYSDVATAVVGLAITAINNLGLSFAWATAGMISAMYSTVDSTTSQDDYLWRQWNWSGGISDAGQFFWVLVDVDPNETVYISHNYMIFGPGYELHEAGTGYWELIAGSPGKSVSDGWNPGMMSDAEKKEFGIEEIPADQIEKRGSELGISPESIKEFQESGDKVFYFAHKMPANPVVPANK
ncbi:MAG: hypothetical protein JW712_04830 [Dehalococcoidales bacterium]|nr:hypothetical protein [Dehalococcoidales bacterium]